MFSNVLDMVIILVSAIGLGALFLLMTVHQDQLSQQRQEVSRKEWA